MVLACRQYIMVWMPPLTISPSATVASAYRRSRASSAINAATGTKPIFPPPTSMPSRSTSATSPLIEPSTSQPSTPERTA